MTFRPPVFTVRLPWWVPPGPERSGDFPNIALENAAQLKVKPDVVGVADDRRPAKLYRAIDFQFPNVALIAKAQLSVKPVVVGVIDETRPVSLTRSRDYPIPNVALIAKAQLSVTPVGAKLDETVPAPAVVRRQDFAFPNVANFVPLVAASPFTYELFGDRPAPQQRVQEFVPRNLPALNAAQLTVKPFFTPIFDRPVVTLVQCDAPFPNLLTSTLAAVSRPVTALLFGDRPLPQQRVQDAPLANLTVRLGAVPFVYRLDVVAPRKYRQQQQDFLGPNLALFIPQITDTDRIPLPINCVMAGNQPLKVGKTVIEVNMPDVRSKTMVSTGGPQQLSKEKSTFTVKTSTRGYD